MRNQVRRRFNLIVLNFPPCTFGAKFKMCRKLRVNDRVVCKKLRFEKGDENGAKKGKKW